MVSSKLSTSSPSEGREGGREGGREEGRDVSKECVMYKLHDMGVRREGGRKGGRVMCVMHYGSGEGGGATLVPNY